MFERFSRGVIDGGFWEYDYVFEFEEEDSFRSRGFYFRGRFRYGSRRWYRGKKRKGVDLILSFREGGE